MDQRSSSIILVFHAIQVEICSRACARQNKQGPTTKAASQKEDGQVRARLEDPLMMNKYSSDI